MMRIITQFLSLVFVLSLFCCRKSVDTAITKVPSKMVADSQKYVDALNMRAILSYHINADTTFYLANKAKDIATRLDYPKGKADALNNLGIFFVVKGKLHLALRYYNQALKIYKQTNDSANCVQLMMNIALVYTGSGEDKRAVEKFDAAMLMGKRLRNDSIMSLVLSNYILSYPKKFKAAQKTKYIYQARAIALKHKDVHSALLIEQLIADDLIARGKRKQGLDLLIRTIDTTVSQKLYFLSMDMLVDIGDQLAKDDPAKAVFYYKKGLAIANQNDISVFKEMISMRLFDFYTKENDNNNAAIYSRQVIALHKEKEISDKSTDIDYLDYVLKEERVSSLEERSEYQMVMLILATTISLLVITILLIVRRNLLKTKKLNKRVVEQYNQMADTLKALEQSQAENTDLLKIIAHDLRSPIAGIHSIATLMMDEGGRTADDQEMLDLIKDSSHNLIELVNDLIHLKFDPTTAHKTPVDLAEMLHHCVSLLQNNAIAKSQRIDLQLEEVTYMASREKLWRVINNLVVNAIKFSPRGMCIEVKMEKTEKHIRISIADEGIGIPVEAEGEIFKMFTEARRHGTAGEESFGLGLAISKQIIKAHDGEIWFERRMPKGTIFIIELPLTP